MFKSKEQPYSIVCADVLVFLLNGSQLVCHVRIADFERRLTLPNGLVKLKLDDSKSAMLSGIYGIVLGFKAGSIFSQNFTSFLFFPVGSGV